MILYTNLHDLFTKTMHFPSCQQLSFSLEIQGLTTNQPLDLQYGTYRVFIITATSSNLIQMIIRNDKLVHTHYNNNKIQIMQIAKSMNTKSGLGTSTGGATGFVAT